MKLPNVKQPCANCPFKKDALKGWLSEANMTEILNASSFLCHKNTKLQCAGHMLIKGDENEFVHLARRLGLDTGLKGQDQVFETKQACIDHHNRLIV